MPNVLSFDIIWKSRKAKDPKGKFNLSTRIFVYLFMCVYVKKIFLPLLFFSFRYFELVSIHGKLDPLVNVDLRPEKRVKVRFTCGNNSEIRSVDVHRSVSDLKNKLEPFAGFSAAKMRLFYVDQDFRDFQVIHIFFFCSCFLLFTISLFHFYFMTYLLINRFSINTGTRRNEISA